MASPTPTADPVVTREARRLADQLSTRLDGHKTSGEAFVASIYGEWGIGKTRCLRDVEAVFQQRLERAISGLADADVSQIVVPVFFDPWQYEHEEHLVVPLLKTIELALEKVARQVEAIQKAQASLGERFNDRAKRFGDEVRSAGGVFGDVAVSLLSAFRFKFAPLEEVFGIGVDFAPKDAFEAARKAKERRDAAAQAAGPAPWYRRLFAPAAADGGAEEQARADAAHARLSKHESIYFDLRSVLQALTLGHRNPSLRLVVLIDDLDRCLPEKAIQVLESVKLFLNVPGFSFVLAVDDEVVERGVAHRYSAYTLAMRGDGTSSGLPITGAEYLEKIVHLPVHLQRWTKSEARDFLRATYPGLFGAEQPAARDEPTGAAAIKTGDAASATAADAQALLDLVLDAVPLVPRKLIRLSEALEYQQAHFVGGLGAGLLWRPLHAVRVTALQQLYPALYRHLRLRAVRYWRLFELRRDDFGEPTLGEGESLAVLRQRFIDRASSPGAQTPTRTQADTLRENLELLQLVDEAGRQRGSPDPLALFPPGTPTKDRTVEGIRRGLTFDGFAYLYLHGVALDPASAALRIGAIEPAPERAAAIADVERFLDALLDADTLARREHLQAAPLDGRLPDDVFERLLSGLAGRGERLLDVEWLRDIAAMTTPEQLLRLYQDHKVLDAHASAAKDAQHEAA